MKGIVSRFLIAIAALAALALASSAPVYAQATPSAVQVIAPLTRDLGALITNTAQGAGTVTSADQSGYNVSRIICVFNQASHTGTPSTTFTIQGKDAASGAYYTLVTSSAITADTTPTLLAAGAGVATAANVSIGLPIPRTWRLSETVGGTTPGVTGTVGCSVQ